MRFLLSLATVLIIAVQLATAQGGVDPAPKKTCTDFLSQQTCDSLARLIGSLKESSGVLQEAIDAAVKQHISNAKDMLAFVKKYIADKIVCEKVLTQDMCTLLNALAAKLKLTKQQVQMAIEKAVMQASTNVQDIYNRTRTFLAEEINCETIFGKTACDNMLLALDKLHEQRSLLKEAILSVATKHYTNTKELLQLVQAELIKRIQNFTCATVLPSSTCTKLVDLAKRLRILPGKIREAVELAVLNGITTAQDVYNFAIDFLTNQITCANILTPTACANLLEATKNLHEQSKLIKEAIMAAALKHITDVREIAKSVRDQLVEKALNFKCTDVIDQAKCDFLTNVAKRFHVSAKDLARLIVETVVNGTRGAKAIYDATLTALVEEAKGLTCEQMLNFDTTACDALRAIARNLGQSIDDLREDIRRAIADKLTTYDEIKKFIQTVLVDEASCNQVFKSPLGIASRIFCKSLKVAAWAKGVTYDRVLEKLRSLYASGITTIKNLKAKIEEWLKDDTDVDTISKRSIEYQDFQKNKDEVIDFIMQVFGGIAKVTEKAKKNIEAELRRLYNEGKLKLWNVKDTIKKLIAKYNPISDEFEDEVPTELQDVSKIYKKAIALMKKTMAKVIEMAKRFKVSQAEFVKMIKEMYESGIESINDAAIEATL